LQVSQLCRLLILLRLLADTRCHGYSYQQKNHRLNLVAVQRLLPLPCGTHRDHRPSGCNRWNPIQILLSQDSNNLSSVRRLQPKLINDLRCKIRRGRTYALASRVIVFMFLIKEVGVSATVSAHKSVVYVGAIFGLFVQFIRIILRIRWARILCFVVEAFYCCVSLYGTKDRSWSKNLD
jgi:hypothetical protein